MEVRGRGGGALHCQSTPSSSLFTCMSLLSPPSMDLPYLFPHLCIYPKPTPCTMPLVPLLAFSDHCYQPSLSPVGHAHTAFKKYPKCMPRYYEYHALYMECYLILSDVANSCIVVRYFHYCFSLPPIARVSPPAHIHHCLVAPPTPFCKSDVDSHIVASLLYMHSQNHAHAYINNLALMPFILAWLCVHHSHRCIV